jgi:hypothetical protein
MRRSSVAFLLTAAAALLFALSIALLPSSARAQSSSEEAQFVSLINQLRASKGLAAFVVDGPLSATACTWTDHMVAADTLSHDPALATEVASVEPKWSKAGENVGVGGDVTSLFNAFVASPGHYRNLVDPAFDHLGVCVSWMPDGKKLYTTHRFVATGSAPVATTTPHTEPPHETHPPTTPAPTTAAPTTTTTEPPTTTTTEPKVPVEQLVPFAADALVAGIAATSPLLLPEGAASAFAESVRQHE